jgi:hypothetical protein
MVPKAICSSILMLGKKTRCECFYGCWVEHFKVEGLCLVSFNACQLLENLIRGVGAPTLFLVTNSLEPITKQS